MCDGVEVSKLRRKALFEFRRKLGMMFQTSALLTDFSVFGNVAFPIRQNTDLSEVLIRHLVLMKLEMVGLRGARDLMPAELSGGMARRVALARAIAMDPMLVMYDEPFTGLDPISMGVIVKLIREVNDTLGMTSLVVTHDVREACTIADYMYLLGNGKVIGEGTPDEMLKSDIPEVRQFMNGLPDGPVRYQYPAPDYADDFMAGRA
jgi:phospholipid/cholesterol/gamma-HCH transport system ATP-binding protein